MIPWTGSDSFDARISIYCNKMEIGQRGIKWCMVLLLEESNKPCPLISTCFQSFPPLFYLLQAPSAARENKQTNNKQCRAWKLNLFSDPSTIVCLVLFSLCVSLMKNAYLHQTQNYVWGREKVTQPESLPWILITCGWFYLRPSQVGAEAKLQLGNIIPLTSPAWETHQDGTESPQELPHLMTSFSREGI